MKNWIKTICVVSSIMAAPLMSAEDNKTDKIISTLKSKLNLNIAAIAESPVPGLYHIETNRGLLYVTENADFLVMGSVYDIKDGMTNVTEAEMRKIRNKGVSEFSDSMIEFKAEDEKYVVNVFTDITCGYCRKLHKQIEAYNEYGITVRYLAYPRGGVNSQAYQQLVSVWCADDQQKAMTAAKETGKVEVKRCKNEVADHFNFGRKIGVNGTPNIILADGSVIGGYVDPSRLIDRLRTL